MDHLVDSGGVCKAASVQQRDVVFSSCEHCCQCGSIVCDAVAAASQQRLAESVDDEITRTRELAGWFALHLVVQLFLWSCDVYVTLTTSADQVTEELHPQSKHHARLHLCWTVLQFTYVLKAGYSVIFLYRRGTFQPYCRSLQDDPLLECFDITNESNIGDSTVDCIINEEPRIKCYVLSCSCSF
ncbi:unnamed protein product [Fraxinus pennsylvanica]|uniref:Uncharacterized protein n=1 Tax=Fraxinus pennsylvanica TaxID=56036 RepID=A0AAD2DRT3_9LAMI|nr:unnamed protein product [Fraxinus pennsylvanica]